MFEHLCIVFIYHAIYIDGVAASVSLWENNSGDDFRIESSEKYYDDETNFNDYSVYDSHSYDSYGEENVLLHNDQVYEDEDDYDLFKTRFDQPLLNLTSRIGGSIDMPCKVHMKKDRTVSWIRVRDLSVLATDDMIYTGDKRFSIKHDVWTSRFWLKIENIKKEDDGFYDCQINTFPKLSTRLHLRVIPNQNISKKSIERPVSDGYNYSETSLNDETNSQNSKDKKRLKLKITLQKWFKHKDYDAVVLICAAEFKNNSEAGSATSFLREDSKNEILNWSLDGFLIKNLFIEGKANVSETWTTDHHIISKLQINYVVPQDAGKITCSSDYQDQATTFQFVVEEETEPIKYKQHYFGPRRMKEIRMNKTRRRFPIIPFNPIMLNTTNQARSGSANYLIFYFPAIILRLSI